MQKRWYCSRDSAQLWTCSCLTWKLKCSKNKTVSYLVVDHIRALLAYTSSTVDKYFLNSGEHWCTRSLIIVYFIVNVTSITRFGTRFKFFNAKIWYKTVPCICAKPNDQETGGKDKPRPLFHLDLFDLIKANRKLSSFDLQLHISTLLCIKESKSYCLWFPAN